MGSSLITIRSMSVGDLDHVVAMETAHQHRPWSGRVLRDELAADNRVYLVAEDDGLAGFGGIMIVGDEAHVTNLLVRPERQRQGVGRRLMIALVDAAVEAGARHLTLEVRKENEAALALYSSMGLAPVGVRPRYYGDDDALILWAHDIDEPEFQEGLA